MSRNANLVKQAVQLSNAAIDLLGQVAGVHCRQSVVRLHGGQRRRRRDVSERWRAKQKKIADPKSRRYARLARV